MTALIERRFDELLEQLARLEASASPRQSQMTGTTTSYIDPAWILNWGVKVRSLLERLGAEAAGYLQAFIDAEKPRSMGTAVERVGRMKAVFLAAQEDFKGGYLTSYRTLIQAEVFASELGQAEELLEKGYSTAAAVIAGVVLETTLREICSSRGIDHGSLNKMNDDLARAGVYNANQKKQITSLAAIRNSAAHGKPDEFTADQVRGMIDDVQRFLLAHQ